MNIFEKATKTKLRFESEIGTLTVEDLWDLDLSKGRVSLDDIAKSLNRIIKSSEEESFVSSSTIRPDLILKFDIVKSIIKTKMANIEKAEKSATTKQQKAKLEELIAKKQDSAYDDMSKEELQEMLTNLDK